MPELAPSAQKPNQHMTANAGNLGHFAGTPAATKCSTRMGMQPVTTATGLAAKEHKRRLPISVRQESRQEFVPCQFFSQRPRPEGL